jgi:hypothetical protein
LNAVKYKGDILDPIILSFLQQRNFDHIFQHDNAICHVARACQDFLNQNHIRVLPWPALSPDLLSIEHLHRVQPKTQGPGIYADTTVKATPTPRFFCISLPENPLCRVRNQHLKLT